MAEPKQIITGHEARILIGAGIQEAAIIAGKTIGPIGQTIALQKSYGDPKVTKDGYTVVKDVSSKDNTKQLGIQMLQAVVERSNKEVGDGTTTTAVVAGELVRLCSKPLSVGANHVHLCNGLTIGLELAIATIKKNAKTINTDRTKQVATISANGDSEIGEQIAKAINVVGPNAVTIEDGKTSNKFELELVKGMKLDRGYISHYFITNPTKQTVELERPFVLVYDDKISSAASILPILEYVISQDRPLLIIADDVEAEALAILVLNKMRGGLKVAAIKAPGFGDRKKAMLEDIAILCDTNVVSKDLGLKLETLDLKGGEFKLGNAQKIHISKDDTVILGHDNNNSRIQERCLQIQSVIKATTSEFDREKLEERLAKLQGGMAVLRVGGKTEMEQKETKDRVEDAYHATRAAIEEGTLPGGGRILIHISKIISDFVNHVNTNSKTDASTKARVSYSEYDTDNLNNLSYLHEDEKTGIDIFKKALYIPLRLILENAGITNANRIADQLEAKDDINHIYDARNNRFVDAYEAGILDAAKVVRIALIDAVEVAKQYCKLGGVIVDVESKKSDAGVPGGRGGDMDMY